MNARVCVDSRKGRASFEADRRPTPHTSCSIHEVFFSPSWMISACAPATRTSLTCLSSSPLIFQRRPRRTSRSSGPRSRTTRTGTPFRCPRRGTTLHRSLQKQRDIPPTERHEGLEGDRPLLTSRSVSERTAVLFAPFAPRRKTPLESKREGLTKCELIHARPSLAQFSCPSGSPSRFSDSTHTIEPPSTVVPRSLVGSCPAIEPREGPLGLR